MGLAQIACQNGLTYLGNLGLEMPLGEFKDNNLSILTSSIFSLSDMDRNKGEQILKEAENEKNNSEIDDQKRYLLNQIMLDGLCGLSIVATHRFDPCLYERLQSECDKINEQSISFADIKSILGNDKPTGTWLIPIIQTLFKHKRESKVIKKNNNQGEKNFCMVFR